MNTDLSVFTNMEEIKLKDRLAKVLTNTKYFDVLVGYFRLTGFYRISEYLQSVEEVRILIGLGTDNKTLDIYQMSIDDVTSPRYLHSIKKEVISEFNESEDSIAVEDGVKEVIDWLRSGKLKIRMTADRNVHAKVYIIRKDQEIVPDQIGNLITGSSNLSLNGLEKNIEFNVELKNSADVKYALNFFEKLWENSIEINNEVVDIVNNQTWMKSDITPYEMYLKTIYEYFEEELDENDKIKIELPEGFMKLKYQEHAVKQAYKILEKHGGVFISDVVGLGKTIIAVMLAKTMKGRKLFIVPPVIKPQWEKILEDFELPRSDKVESSGKIEQIYDWIDIDTYDYIFVDEAHRFRNASSSTYDMLKEICYNKKVILITATPQNNNIFDIANLITLFQDARRSSIMPKCHDLDAYFRQLHAQIKFAIGTDDESYVIKNVTEKIRKEILKTIMIRRTRTEIKEYYGKDLQKQGLNFPKLNSPVRLGYCYSPIVEEVFDETISLLKELSFARYTPLLFLKDKSKLGDRKSGQENMKGFIKTLLVKRLESSIFAFKMSLGRLTSSYDDFLELWKRDKVIIGGMSRGKKLDLSDLIELSEVDLINLNLEGLVESFKRVEFKDNYDELIRKDAAIFTSLADLWSNVDYIRDDFKYDKLIEYLSDFEFSNKLIIFSESKETVEYLNKRLINELGNVVVSYSGSESDRRKDYIRQNFDPNYVGEKLNDKLILITTDSMSEGVNLHRANTVLNYDLPWNPTKVMQRVGRINRIGTKYDELNIVNFFPALITKGHLSLEDAIRIKIEMFHNLLGSDSKYITNDEEVSVHGLYDSIMKIVESNETDEQLDSIKQSLLAEIIDVKENNLELYNVIKALPIKCKIAKVGAEKGLLTFIKQGLIKEFYFVGADSKESKFVGFEDAISMLRSKQKEKSRAIPKDYFELLDINKSGFINSIFESKHLESTSRASANEKLVRKWIKFLAKNNSQEKQYLERVSEAVNEGRISSYRIGRLAKSLKNCTVENDALEHIKSEVSMTYLDRRDNYKLTESKLDNRVVILSEYIIKGINNG